MSNEELATAIQTGRNELYPELWEQVRRFVVQQANRRYRATEGYGGVEVEDLIQSGFLALVEAVSYFDPAGGCSFLSVLANCLKTAFARAGGYRTSKRDPLNECKSLDEPIDDPEDDTLLDLQADPRDDYEDANRKIWLEDLRGALDSALSKLPEDEADVIISRFFRGQAYKQIGAESGATLAAVRKRELHGLQKLRRPSAGLTRFLENNTDYYTQVGAAAFQRTHTSAVELLSIKREALRESYLEAPDFPLRR